MAHRIPFGRMKSMQRVYIMLGAILDESLRGEEDLARARTVQCMKAIHQYVLDQTWRTAWPLTFLEDPFSVGRQGGTEPEMEAILAYLRTQDDLRRRAGQFGEVRDQVSDAEGDPQGRQGQQRKPRVPKPKAKGQK